MTFAEKKAIKLGIPKYTPQIPAGSQFPPEIFKNIYGDDETTEETPMQQMIKYDIDVGKTQAFDLPTMIKYADLQRNRDLRDELDKKRTPAAIKEREVAPIGARRDPRKPGGCSYKMCRMPRGGHAANCLGEGPEVCAVEEHAMGAGQGEVCTAEDHAMGICKEKDDNRRHKMVAVGLDPDTVDMDMDDPTMGLEDVSYFDDRIGQDSSASGA